MISKTAISSMIFTFIGSMGFVCSLVYAIPAQDPPGLQSKEISLEHLKLLDVLPLAATLHHVQGIDVDGEKLWVSSVDRQNRKGFLHLLELPSGKLLRQVEVQQGDRFHPGGIALDPSSVWLPVAEYHREGQSNIQQRDRHTLKLISSFEVSDHIGCVAAGSDFLIGGNWDSRLLYFWDIRGKFHDRRENPRKTAYQDMKIVGGMLVASGALAGPAGSIDWLDPQSLRLQCSISAGATDRGIRYTNEGMAIRSGKLFLLPEDGPSRLFIFRLTPGVGAEQ